MPIAPRLSSLGEDPLRLVSASARRSVSTIVTGTEQADAHGARARVVDAQGVVHDVPPRAVERAHEAGSQAATLPRARAALAQALTVNAGRYCLSSVTCHNLITLKWVAEQTGEGEAG